MEELLDLLPKQIDMSILIVIGIGLWNLWSLITKKIRDRKDAKKAFELEVLEKERLRTKFDVRISKVELEIEELKDDFKESKFEIRAEFLKLENKIDKILEFLIPVRGK